MHLVPPELGISSARFIHYPRVSNLTITLDGRCCSERSQLRQLLWDTMARFHIWPWPYKFAVILSMPAFVAGMLVSWLVSAFGLKISEISFRSGIGAWQCRPRPLSLCAGEDSGCSSAQRASGPTFRRGSDHLHSRHQADVCLSGLAPGGTTHASKHPSRCLVPPRLAGRACAAGSIDQPFAESLPS
jgi:hypothetical protein